jgi:hypothetical protein
MDEVDVSRQLKQMTDFIRQEAVEKAVEIEAAAAEVKPAPPRAPHCLLEELQARISRAAGRDPDRAGSDLVQRALGT